MNNANLDLWKEMRKSTLSRVAAHGKCTRSVIAKYGRENEENRKSGLEISFPVSAYQHETSASAALAPTDSQHYRYGEIPTYMQHKNTTLP